MAEETIQIIRIDTGEAVKSVNDLRENVKILKERLGDLEIGTTEYQDTLDELKVNQAAVKDAMYATTASMEDLAKSATGTSESYNSLVHRMASLKEELRATDVSTQQGKARFKELAGQINEVNNTLKDMDALQGNFQRNVGNYPGLMKNFAGSLDALDKGLKATTTGVGGLKGGFDALAVNPAFAILGVVVQLFGSLADTLKEDETTMAAVNKAGMSLEPIFKFLKGILEKVSSIVSDLITKVSAFVQSNGLISKIINGVVGVGNAIIKYITAPFKGVIEAIKVFQEKGIKGLRDAAKAFGNEMKTGLSFKSNFQAGESIVDAITAGVKEKKESAKTAAAQVGKEVGKELAYNVQQEFDKALAESTKRFEEGLRAREQAQKELDDMTEAALAETNAEIEAYFAEQDRMGEEDKRKKKERAEAIIDTMFAVADATSSILGTLADYYESDEENAEKNANKIKALRVSAAIIDTISGAVGAYMQAVASMPPPFGAIVGGVQAAAITATGLAQIAQMKSTKVSGDASNSSPKAPAVTSAPAMTMDIKQVRSVTSASEEERLNQMASEQRVVLVMSDLEVKQNQSRVQVAEASF